MRPNGDHMLYTVKYAPKKLEELIGNSEKIGQVRQWMLHWLSGKKRKPLLLWGPPGTGKTSIAYALKSQYDLDLLEMNASELRNKKRVERILGSSSLAGSLFGRTRLVLIDDADVLAGRKDSGGALAIKNFLKESNHPAIVTATDIWDKKLSPIRGECEKVEMKRVNKASIRKLLGQIAKAENLTISEEKVSEIAENAAGDVRAALNDLQSLSPTSRTHERDIFQIVRGVLKAETYADVREVMRGNIDYDSLKLWIDENIPYEYRRPEDVAAAYDWLSKADIFDGRIKKTHWKLLKYSIDLSTAGVAIAKKEVYRHFTKYSFPSYLRSMARTRERRALLKSIGRKIGRKVHASARDSLDYLPLLKDLGKMHSTQIMDFYEFDENEMAFIMETSPRKVKRKS